MCYIIHHVHAKNEKVAHAHALSQEMAKSCRYAALLHVSCHDRVLVLGMQRVQSGTWIMNPLMFLWKIVPS